MSKFTKESMQVAYSEVSDTVINELVPYVSGGCDVFERNAIILVKKFIEFSSNSKFSREENLRNIIESEDFYRGALNRLSSKHVFLERKEEVGIKLQTAVIDYTVMLGIQKTLQRISGLKKRLYDMNKAAKKLQSLLSLDDEMGLLLAGLAISDFKNALENRGILSSKKKIGEHFTSIKIAKLHHELEIISSLETKFKESVLSDFLQFGRSGPKENSALELWVTDMVKIWVENLGRSLTFSNDLNSGRERFLNFAEDCFESVHPALGVDTVRNVYEKLRSKGRFDNLLQNSSS